MPLKPEDERILKIATVLFEAEQFGERALLHLHDDSGQLAISSLEAARDRISRAIAIATEIRNDKKRGT